MTDLITIKLPRDLVDQIRPLAAAHNRSLSGELREALSRYIDAERFERRRAQEIHDEPQEP